MVNFNTYYRFLRRAASHPWQRYRLQHCRREPFPSEEATGVPRSQKNARLLGPPWGPGHRATEGSYEGAFSYERGTAVVASVDSKVTALQKRISSPASVYLGSSYSTVLQMFQSSKHRITICRVLPSPFAKERGCTSEGWFNM